MVNHLKMVGIVFLISAASSDNEMDVPSGRRGENNEPRISTRNGTTGKAGEGGVYVPLFGGQPPENQCQKDLLYTWKYRRQPWARNMLDSCGKPETAIKQGNNNWFGDYDTCLEVEAPTSTLSPNGFRGRYVLAVWSYAGEFTPTFEYYSVGTCIPDSCDPEEFHRSYFRIVDLISEDYPLTKKVLSGMDLTKVTPVETGLPLSTSAKWCIFLAVVLISLSVFGTYIETSHGIRDKTGQGSDAAQNDRERSNLPYHNAMAKERSMTGASHGCMANLLRCFSVSKNFSSLMDTTEIPGQIACLYGIRSITMCWVVMEHVVINSISIMGDLHRLIHSMDTLLRQIIIEGQFAVDSFFLVSGFLHAYLFMKSKTVMTPLKCFVLLFHRFLRISPAFFFIIFFCATILPSLNHGPLWGYMDFVMGECQDYWWTHALYISNLFSEAEHCLPWAWYLPNDMQFFVFGTVILAVMKRYPRLGYSVTWFVMVALMISTFVISYQGDYKRTMVYIRELEFNIGDSQNHLNALTNALYSKPYSRAGAYLVGMLYGYNLFKNSNQKRIIHKSRLAVYWLLATLGALTAIFGIHVLPPSRVGYGIYHGTFRNIWGASVGWVIYVCATGNAYLVNKILSWKGFYPLSRLTYCSYLVHPIFIYYYYYGLRQPLRYDMLLLIIVHAGVTTLATLTAFLVHLFIEAPFSKLNSILFKVTS